MTECDAHGGVVVHVDEIDIIHSHVKMPMMLMLMWIMLMLMMKLIDGRWSHGSHCPKEPLALS
jgi:hypothetical protein